MSASAEEGRKPERAARAQKGAAATNAGTPGNAAADVLPKESGVASEGAGAPGPSAGEAGSAKPRSRWRRTRGLVAFALVGLVCLGLATGTGTGDYSAFGVSWVSQVCPVGALEAMVTGKATSWHLLAGLAVAVVVVVLFGKAFCAWGCPVPWLRHALAPKAEAADAAADRREVGRSSAQGAPAADGQRPAVGTGSSSVDSPEAGRPASGGRGNGVADGAPASTAPLSPVGGARDGVRLDSRHVVLAGALASAAVFGLPVFCLVCPVGLTAATIACLWHLVQYNDPTWGLVVFPAIIVAELALMRRRWCRWVCPIAALTSLLSNANPLFRVRVDKNRCLRQRGVDCRECVRACPERLDPHSSRVPECSKCGACVEACPAHAISMRLCRIHEKSSEQRLSR